MVPESQWEGYERLRVAIMKTAVQDYKIALKKSEREGQKCEKEIALERFFLSAWGQFLSGDNGKLIIEKCRTAHKISKQGHSKLSLEDEIDIYKDVRKGMTEKEAAEKYGICVSTVRRCVRKWM